MWNVGKRQHGASMARIAVATALVGREVEVVQLRAAVDAATQGSGSVLFLVGEPGIGKSRLTQSIAAEAAALSFAVLRGRAVQGGAPAPYRPLAEALSSAVRTGAGPDAFAVGPFRSTLARLVPVWRVDGQGPLDESLVGLAEAVLRFLRAAAGERGALLVLEDLHWADPETVTIVEYLADNLATERVLCVATLRDESPSPG